MPNPVGTIESITLPNGETYSIKDTTYSNATQSASGLMSSIDKIKLDDMEVATVVETQAYLGIS